MNANTKEKFNGSDANCIMWALQNLEAEKLFTKSPEFKSGKIADAFIKTCSELNIRCSPVSCLEEANIILYWWDEIERVFRFKYTDYHVLRKIEDVWWHKDGYKNEPSEFDKREFEEELLPYPDKAFFKIE